MFSLNMRKEDGQRVGNHISIAGQNIIHLLLIFGIIFQIIALPATGYVNSSRELQELEKKLSEAKNEEKCIILNRIARQYLDLSTNPGKIIHYSKKALVSAQKVGNIEQEIYALVNLAHGFRRVNNFQSAISFGNKALKMAEANNYKRGILLALGVLADLYLSISNIQKAIDYRQRMKVIYQGMGDMKGEGEILFDLGSCYRELGQLSKSLQYLDDALVLFKKTENDMWIAQTQIAKVHLYIETGEINFATKLLFDTVKYCEVKGLASMSGRAYQALGTLYMGLEKYSKASEFYQKALRIFETLKYDLGILSIKIKLGSLFRLQKKISKITYLSPRSIGNKT